jgi:hypothetical protein
MHSVGSYIEQLPFGGSLHIRNDVWSIGYYFPGPDARYNGSHKSIKGQDVEPLVEVLRMAWSELASLAASAPPETRVTREYKHEVSISVSGTGNCLYLFSYRISIRTEQQLLEIVESYRHALDRVPRVQAFLKELHDGASHLKP